MKTVSEKGLLEFAFSLLLSKLPELVENFEGIGFSVGIYHSFDENIEEPASPVEIAVIDFLQQVGDFLNDFHKVLRPSWLRHGPNDMPSLYRSIVDNELVFLLVFRLGGNIDSSLNVRKG